MELQLLLENLPEEMCLSLRIEEAISIILWPLFHPPPKVGEVKVILKVNKYMTFTPSAVLCLLSNVGGKVQKQKVNFGGNLATLYIFDNIANV